MTPFCCVAQPAKSDASSLRNADTVDSGACAAAGRKPRLLLFRSDTFFRSGSAAIGTGAVDCMPVKDDATGCCWMGQLVVLTELRGSDRTDRLRRWLRLLCILCMVMSPSLAAAPPASE
eukprot:gene14044-biopygen6995